MPVHNSHGDDAAALRGRHQQPADPAGGAAEAGGRHRARVRGAAQGDRALHQGVPARERRGGLAQLGQRHHLGALHADQVSSLLGNVPLDTTGIEWSVMSFCQECHSRHVV